MRVTALTLPEILILRPERFEDARGFFSETYNRNVFAASGIDLDFVQDNHSLSKSPGTIRGLHYQVAPFAQSKLVRVLRGAVLDVAVDIRRSSPNFGKWVATRLSAKEGNQIFVPAGFAHGYCTLEPDTEVFYKVTQHYSPDHEFGILWNDPAIGVDWPVTPDQVSLSGKDRNYPLLQDAPALYD